MSGTFQRSEASDHYRPEMTDAGLHSTSQVIARNEFNQEVRGNIAIERALTLYLDKRELVTLMTLGNYPELLVLGWLLNQRIVRDLKQIKSLQVDWDTESVSINSDASIGDLERKLAQKTVTTGCGQGTVFGNLMDELTQTRMPEVQVRQSQIYRLLHNLNSHNEIYKSAGAVHGCALCHQEQSEIFIEDVGRHNAVDAIAGYMWLNRIAPAQRVFYTTGRLTSEMVIKVALMGVPVLLSRSGVTQMGLDIARKVGVVLIARAKGRHFLVYNGQQSVIYDEMPTSPR